jgi:hypothetical protein
MISLGQMRVLFLISNNIALTSGWLVLENWNKALVPTTVKTDVNSKPDTETERREVFNSHPRSALMYRDNEIYCLSFEHYAYNEVKGERDRKGAFYIIIVPLSYP